MTQYQMLLKSLKRWVSPIDALREAGTMKLATRVGELRRIGHVIEDRWVEANGKKFKAYRLKAKAATRANG